MNGVQCSELTFWSLEYKGYIIIGGIKGLCNNWCIIWQSEFISWYLCRSEASACAFFVFTTNLDRSRFSSVLASTAADRTWFCSAMPNRRLTMNEKPLWKLLERDFSLCRQMMSSDIYCFLQVSMKIAYLTPDDHLEGLSLWTGPHYY